jgi:hypothetical protein
MRSNIFVKTQAVELNGETKEKWRLVQQRDTCS